MTQLKDRVAQLAKDYFEDARQIRQHIHANPELSFEEFETSKYIISKLDELNIPYKSGYVKTGIIGHIEGAKPGNGPVIGLRADMDALPVNEANDVSYCSKNKGVMHACGHDVHSASLLGAAKILNELKDTFAGTILLIFQPGEESHPGGAKLLLEEGALNDPKPDLIIGQHVLPEMETGHVGFRSGMYMASGDEIHFKVKGHGGHGALPHKLTDTVLTTAHIITSMQQIASRNAPPEVPTVLSFGKVIADGATNIIPNEVTVAGTFRTMDEEWRAKAKKNMVRIGESIAEGMGAEIEFDIKHGYPVLVNTPEVTDEARSYAIEFLGKENVEEMGLRMTCEDFAYYSLEYPVCFLRFGVKPPNEKIKGHLHTPHFDIDENAIETAMSNLAYMTLRFAKAE